MIGKGMARRWLGVLVLSLACTDEGSDHALELGILEHFLEPSDIDAPSTARVGARFTVTVTTYGGGCISGPARTDVIATADADVACPPNVPGNALVLAHPITLAFETPGPKTLRVHGRRVKYYVDEDILHVRSVVVQ
jgi:hypothetical protein